MPYFTMAVSDRTPKAHLADIQYRFCPLGCGQTLARIAERMKGAPWNWVPFGYRCTKCNAIYWDSDDL